MSYMPPFYKKTFHSFRRFIAKKWLSNMPALQIAITGSQGKTSTTNIIYQLLRTVGPTVCTDINLDTTYNVPITALKITPWTRFALFELGVDHPREMDQHLEIVHPKIAIITGVSPVHTDQEHFGSLENLIKEKQKLVGTLPPDGYAILNGDDENVRKMAPHTKAKVIFYGKNKTNDVYASNIDISLKETSFILYLNNLAEQKQIPISTQLIGSHHVYTILSSLVTMIAVQKTIGINTSINRLIEVVQTLKPLQGRMSVEKGPMETILLNDSLRANPTSTTSGLQTLSTIHHQGNKIAVLAEMGELREPKNEHEQIGAIIAKLKIDSIVLIGPLHKYTKERAVRDGFDPNSIFWTENIIKASDILKTLIKKNDLIYLKGSLLRHVERVLMILNGENVKCNVNTCPFYHHCPQCKYKLIGYNPSK